MMKPSRILRTGLALAAAGTLLVVGVGGLTIAGVEASIFAYLIDIGAVIAAAGAALLGYGAVAYRRRSGALLGKREVELKRRDDAAAKDSPAEEAELSAAKRAKPAALQNEDNASPAEPGAA